MRRIPWPALMAVVCCALVARAEDQLPVGSPAPAVSSIPRLDIGEGAALVRMLRRSREPDVDPESVISSIAGLGTPILDEALLILDQRSLPALDGGRPQMLSSPQQALLLAALERLDSGSVFAAALTHLAPSSGVAPARQPEPSTSARAAAILAAGCGARPVELGKVFSMVGNCERAALDPSLEAALQTAGAAVFRRSPLGFAAWAASWRRLPAAVLPALVRGASASGDPHALPLLESMLPHGGDTRRLVLAGLARQRAPREVSDALSHSLRELLSSADAPVQQAACAAIAALGDFRAAPDLVGLLDEADKPLRASAYRALCSLSGLALPDQASSWRVWLVRESQWFEARADQLARLIEGGEEQQALDALRELRLYRWRRHELSDAAARGMWRSEESVVALACDVLVSLDSPWAKTLLETTAREGNPLVSSPAAEALARMQSRGAR